MSPQNSGIKSLKGKMVLRYGVSSIRFRRELALTREWEDARRFGPNAEAIVAGEGRNIPAERAVSPAAKALERFSPPAAKAQGRESIWEGLVRMARQIPRKIAGMHP